MKSALDDRENRCLGSPPYPTVYPTGYYVGINDPALHQKRIYRKNVA